MGLMDTIIGAFTGGASTPRVQTRAANDYEVRQGPTVNQVAAPAPVVTQASPETLAGLHSAQAAPGATREGREALHAQVAIPPGGQVIGADTQNTPDGDQVTVQDVQVRPAAPAEETQAAAQAVTAQAPIEVQADTTKTPEPQTQESVAQLIKQLIAMLGQLLAAQNPNLPTLVAAAALPKTPEPQVETASGPQGLTNTADPSRTASDLALHAAPEGTNTTGGLLQLMQMLGQNATVPANLNQEKQTA
jgi:hypothetical protein